MAVGFGELPLSTYTTRLYMYIHIYRNNVREREIILELPQQSTWTKRLPMMNCSDNGGSIPPASYHDHKYTCTRAYDVHVHSMLYYTSLGIFQLKSG